MTGSRVLILGVACKRDIVCMVTDHSGVDYDRIIHHAPLILDRRNALKSFDSNKGVLL